MNLESIIFELSVIIVGAAVLGTLRVPLLPALKAER